MYFFDDIDFNDPEIKKKFSVRAVDHKPTLEHYYACYNAALLTIFKKWLQKPNYTLNSKAHGILTLLRHSFELCLKLNLEKQGKEIIETHDFTKLVEAFGDPSAVPVAFQEVLSTIDTDKDGSAFRYFLDEGTGKPYFEQGDRIEVSPILKKYNSIVSDDHFVVGKISDVFDYGNRGIVWDLTFHVGESSSLTAVQGQFADTASYLIDAVLKNEASIDHLYLPLLYLIRHSLELGLKSNISDVKELDAALKVGNFQHGHSLARLYGGYRGYLDSLDIDVKASPEIKRQYHDYKERYDKLNETIHQLDVNSRYFKYPFAKAGQPHPAPFDVKKIDLVEILKLVYFTNPFVLFTNEVLAENGLHQLPGPL